MRMMKAGENLIHLQRQIFSAGWLSHRCLFKNVIIAGLFSHSANGEDESTQCSQEIAFEVPDQC